MEEEIRQQIEESISVKREIMSSKEMVEQIGRAGEMLVQAYKNGNKVLLCGNGGSASDAQHIEGELVGRFQKERRPLPAIAMTANSATVTAISNDYGYSNIFYREVEAYGKKGDVLIGISTSGNSENIYQALSHAKELGVISIALLGKDGGKCAEIADLSIIVPSEVTARIQESHIMIGHILCSIVERKLFG